MRKIMCIVFAACAVLSSCDVYENIPEDSLPSDSFSLKEVAVIMSSFPIEREQMNEVRDAVNSSSSNGYDEEYTMSKLISSPGCGVGEDRTKADGKTAYTIPLRDMFAEYFSSMAGSKSSLGSVDSLMEELENSGYQIYWPYSEDWDGESYPIITFDPGFGAESNYGYQLSVSTDGRRIVDSVYVDENVARSRPVWVINRNDDEGYTPLDFFTSSEPATKAPCKKLMLKSFKMLRNYDSWFGGGSEFFIKCGSADGFRDESESDLKLYNPSVTDFMIVLKRRQVGEEVPFDAIIISDLTEYIDKVAFLITEDDGGTSTSWKCSATVKIKSKSYGFDLEIPYNEKDDIVWRGQLSMSYFNAESPVTGRFGDVSVTFAIEE